MDKRLKQISYSSRSSLTKCPRRYQLSKLGVASNQFEDTNSDITLSFGHTVGLGVQLVWQGAQSDEIIWKMFLAWEVPILIDSTKHTKSLWYAIHAVKKFIDLRDAGFLEDWELLYWQGKPAVELSYLIDLGDDYNDRGFIDIVVQHRVNKKVMVIELKTSSSKSITQADYGNSTQALGYAVVLDYIMPGLNSFEVLYLVYRTESQEWINIPMFKSSLLKAEWIQTVVLARKMLELYESFNYFPREGSACKSMFGECKYYGICNLSDNLLIKPISKSQEAALEKELSNYQIKLKIEDIISNQLHLLGNKESPQ